MKQVDSRSLTRLAGTIPFGIATLQALLAIQPVVADDLEAHVATIPASICNTCTWEDGTLANTVSLDEIDRPATTVEEWFTQIAQATLTEIVGIQVDETEEGIRLLLDINGELATPETSIVGNALITDIPNAVLKLSEGEDFLVSDPTNGIALIDVATLPNNRVRIAITGTDGPPVIDLQTDASGLVVNATVGTPTAQSASDDSIQVVVTGEQDGYFVPNANTATRTNTSILDTPQSIQVIPQQVLEDQQIIRVDDALRNVSGIVGRLDPFAGTDTNLTIRGFTPSTFSSGAILRDGFRVTDNLGTQETANIERIEVIKGPSSVLYGQTNPGGIINLVTKRPLSEPFYELELQAGSFGLIRPSIDISGPLTNDRALRYRLNLAYQNENGFRDFDTETDRFFVAPVLSWDIGDRTNFTVLLEYTDEDNPFDLALPAFGTEVVDVPADRIVGEPDDFFTSNSLVLGYDLEHQFSDDWTLNHGFRYTNQDYFVITARPFFQDETTGDITRFFADRGLQSDDYLLQTTVVGEFNTGAIQHQLLAGVDLNFNRYDERFTRADVNTPLVLNIFNPVYGAPRPDFETLVPFPGFDSNTDRVGVFLQDQITFSDELILVGSVRYDNVDSRSPDTGSEQSDDAVSPRIGVIYQPAETVALYANYSQAFTPNLETTSTGEFLDPERASGFEVGAKAELLDSNLLVTLAYFDITKRNVASTDPNDPFSVVATGEQRSQGVELDVAGEILPGWNIIANYAYTDARITEDNTIPEGNRLFNAPYHSAGLWTTYEIQQGRLQGLGFGVGFNYVGSRFGDLANSFEADDYFLTNAALFYERDSWQLRLNFNNLFDIDYISNTDVSRTFGNVPGAPFAVVGSVSVRF